MDTIVAIFITVVIIGVVAAFIIGAFKENDDLNKRRNKQQQELHLATQKVIINNLKRLSVIKQNHPLYERYLSCLSYNLKDLTLSELENLDLIVEKLETDLEHEDFENFKKQLLKENV